MFWILPGLFPVEQLHSSLLLIEGDAGVLWELCWKGRPPKHGRSSHNFSSTVWMPTVDPNPLEWSSDLWTSYEMQSDLLFCTATLRLQEPVPTGKCIVWPVNAISSAILLNIALGVFFFLCYNFIVKYSALPVPGIQETFVRLTEVFFFWNLSAVLPEEGALEKRGHTC